jgi:hypothetical protein
LTCVLGATWPLMLLSPIQVLLLKSYTLPAVLQLGEGQRI